MNNTEPNVNATSTMKASYHTAEKAAAEAAIAYDASIKAIKNANEAAVTAFEAAEAAKNATNAYRIAFNAAINARDAYDAISVIKDVQDEE